MSVKNLIDSFILEKKYRPVHSNELLDFIQRKYIQEEMCIVEYKKLYSKLEKLNAEKPQSYMIKAIIPFESINIPS